MFFYLGIGHFQKWFLLINHIQNIVYLDVNKRDIVYLISQSIK